MKAETVFFRLISELFLVIKTFLRKLFSNNLSGMSRNGRVN